MLTVFLLNLGFLQTQHSAADAALRTVMVAVALLGALWLMNMMVISTSFTFRLRDLARLSVFYIGASLKTTLGNLAALFLAGVLLFLTSDWVLLLCGSLFVYLCALSTEDLVARVQARFTAPADGASAPQHPTE